MGDRKALSTAMKRVAEDPNLSEQLSSNGVKIKENYKLKKIADRFLEEAGIIQ